MAILHRAGARESKILPEGAIVTVISESQEGPNALVGALVDGELVQIFAEDVRSRGDQLIDRPE